MSLKLKKRHGSKDGKNHMDKVTEYIKENWTKTFHLPEGLRGNVKITRPFVSPCVAEAFTDMFYWDTYFINEGLLLDGYAEQAENNVINIATFINVKGYMPNANSIPKRTQPPFFTRMVYELYKHKNDKSVIEKYIETVLKELAFWKENRTNAIGLSSYGDCCASDDERIAEGKWWHKRVQEPFPEDREAQIVLGKDIAAIAESGLDFNMRFRTKESKVAAHEFSHLDLDCILYDAEIKTAEMLDVIGRTEGAEVYAERAERRKGLMDKYYRDNKTGIYTDYNIKTGEFSKILSAASLYPYTFGVSNDKVSAVAVLKRLELKYGLAVCENRGDDVYFQWDYPFMWPAATYLAYQGLKNIGLNSDAKRIAKKYNDVVYDVFEKTGRIWEKYDAATGGIAVTSEYKTPEMMGWSAAVYRCFAEALGE